MKLSKFQEVYKVSSKFDVKESLGRFAPSMAAIRVTFW
jgi:hypothetical protein